MKLRLARLGSPGRLAIRRLFETCRYVRPFGRRADDRDEPGRRLREHLEHGVRRKRRVSRLQGNPDDRVSDNEGSRRHWSIRKSSGDCTLRPSALRSSVGKWSRFVVTMTSARPASAAATTCRSCSGIDGGTEAISVARGLATTDLNVPVRLPLEIALTGVGRWTDGAIA